MYGGDNPNDNSGSICYISIRHGGASIGENNEINGLTLGGVGNETTINNIEVVGNLDDGIEFFGGTANVNNALVWAQGDDAFDVDQGYAGTLDNFVYLAGEDSDHGLEIDGPEGSATGRFTFTNGTLKAGSIIYNNERIIDQMNLLPSMNLVYSLSKTMSFRTSFSKTVARPSFKEASIAQIYDAISDQTFIGNIELEQTKIDNYDVRYEGFYSEGQMFSVSGFYKNFTNPIELVAFSSSAPNDLQPRNMGNAEVVGLEFEFRKNLGFVSNNLSGLYTGANFTFVQSQVELAQGENGEYQSRLTNAREGETINTTRQMQGQSPYIINGYINYANADKSWETNLSYNVQGPSLAIVGIGLNPDVYSSPYHDMSFKVTKGLGAENNMRISFAANNLLNSTKEKV